MLTSAQENYLKTIPNDKYAEIKDFDPKAKETAEQIINEIEKQIPELEIFFGGSTALEISGQNDIDLNILSTPKNFGNYLPSLILMFGHPTNKTDKLVTWNFQKNGYDVELYLTDKDSSALQEQIKTFELLRDNLEYRKEYEKVKLSSHNGSFKEYMRLKYEFFNKILKENQL